METLAETLKDPLHVAPLLHGDHTSVVFLVDPHQEGFLIVVPGIDRHLIIIFCRNIEANVFGLLIYMYVTTKSFGLNEAFEEISTMRINKTVGDTEI